MGPLPRLTKGHQYILVVTDNFSKYSVLFALRSATADMICRKIEEDIFLIYGVPRLIICDNGPQYRSRQFQTLADRYGTRIRYNANYHPQANPTERNNRTLKTMLASYIADNHRVWDSQLPKLGCALRTAKHEAIGHTPYYVNFGRHMILRGDEYDTKNFVTADEGITAKIREEGFKKALCRSLSSSGGSCKET